MDIRKNHRTETYEVEISGLNGLDLDLPPSCKVLDIQELSGHSILKITGHMNHKPNELLSHLIRQTDVHAFREILPTMNDVFIATVNAAEK
jgi:ABC-2 type transport system ATP-binding protein